MIYFIGGLSNREFKYSEIFDSIKNNNQEIVSKFFDAENKEEETFLNSVSFNSIFSPKELIVFRRAEKSKDLEKILDYISKLDIDNKEIIIDYGHKDGKIPVKLNKKLDLLKKENKIEVYLFTSSDDKSLKNYIETELNINSKDSLTLLEMIGKNPFKMKNEIEKIKVYLDGEQFDINEIKKIISIDKEFQLYEMTTNILSNNPTETMKYLEKTKEYMGILYSLYGELETMYKLKLLIKDGIKFSSNYIVFQKQFDEVKDAFKVNGRLPNPYAIFKKMEKIKNYTMKNLKKLVFRCWEVEKNIKSGKIEMEAGVETLILEIVSLYRKKL